MAYEPTTEAGKEALASGADPAVVEAMEKEGELADSDSKEKDTPAETPEEKEAREKAEADAAAKKADEEKDDEEDDEDQNPNRTPRHMPVWKHKEEMKHLEREHQQKLQEAQNEAQKKISELAQKPGGANDEDIAKLSDELGLSAEVASVLVERIAQLVEKKAGLPDIKATLESRKKADLELQEEKGFESEWSLKETADAIKAAAGDKEISVEVKNKIKDLAYSTTYARYRLSDIIKLNAGTLFPDAPKGAKTAEAGRGGVSRGPASKSIEEMSPEEVNDLSDEDFMKFSNELGGKGSRFTKVTKPKK